MTFEHLNSVRKMKEIIDELKELNKEIDALLETKDEKKEVMKGDE